jgi:hypothetical protein
MHANPLWHNGIIGSRFPNMKQFPCLATNPAGLRWSVSPESLVFVQVGRRFLSAAGHVWNPVANH